MTTNPHKVEEANKFFKEKYGFNLEIVNPEFEIIKIQAKTCAEVVKFSVKYACEKLNCAYLKSYSGMYMEALSELREIDHEYESKFWGTAKDDFAKWFAENKDVELQEIKN